MKTDTLSNHQLDNILGIGTPFEHRVECKGKELNDFQRNLLRLLPKSWLRQGVEANFASICAHVAKAASEVRF